MTAVIRAILTDTEARDINQTSSPTFGKLREPVVRLTQWAKAFKVTSPSQKWSFNNTASLFYDDLNEVPGLAPSVFNWFSPRYSINTTASQPNSTLLAPEFQLVNESTVISYVNFMQQIIPSGDADTKPNYSSLTPLASDSHALLAELNLVLAANQISNDTLTKMQAALDTMPVATADDLNNRIYTAILLVMASPEYLVLR
jgi:hypothetical protein